MKILAINGSHRAGKNVATLLGYALEEAEKLGCETELVELSQLDIKFCLGCNRCLFKPDCKIQDDDMNMLNEKMLAADGIILGSPNYFCNVSARTKNFMDRTRPLHMLENKLKGKVAGYVSMSGLDNYGGEQTNAIIDGFFATHEMNIVHARPLGNVFARTVTGSLMAGMDGLQPVWRRSVEEDPCAPEMARQLGRDMVALIKKLDAEA